LKVKSKRIEATVRTGYPAGLLQDDSKEFSQWLASKPGARRQVKEVCKELLKAKHERLLFQSKN